MATGIIGHEDANHDHDGEYQPLDADLTTIAANITAAGHALLDDANAAAQIATLGLDADIATLALPASTTISAFGATVVDDADAAAVRTTIDAAQTAHTHATTDITDLAEVTSDTVGAMFTGNTETFIAATYQDADNTIDLVVPVLDEDDMVSDSAAHLPTQQSVKAYADTKQPLDADLTTLSTAFASASASGPATLALHEDTDNGTNKITLTAPASIASDKAVTFQDVAGTVYVSSGTDVAIADGGTGASTQTAGFNALSPTTTKGDLIVDDGTDAVRLPVGVTNGHALVVDSAETTGVKWAAVTASPAGTDTQVQFNDGGALGGEAGMTYDKATDTLTLVGDVIVADDAYAVGWNGNFEVPTKNAVYDKIETMGGGVTLEQVYDALGGGVLVAGNNIDITHDDLADTITIDVETLTLADVSDITASTAEVNLLDGVTASTAEINHIDGVTSAIQTQLDGKQPLDTDLTTLSTAFATASASAAASLALHEDTDNGTNKVTIIAPASVASDKVQTLQDVTGNILVSGGTDVAIADGGTGQSTAVAAFDALSPLTTRGDILVRDASNNVRLAKGAAATYLKMGANDPAWTAITARGAKSIPVGDGTNLVGTGPYISFSMGFDGTFIGWRISALKFTSGSTGSIVFDLWGDDSASYPPTVADSISTSKPTLSSAAFAEDMSITDWTPETFVADDVFILNIDSRTAIALCTLDLVWTAAL